MHPVEFVAIGEPDLPSWAKEQRVPIDELWRVLRGERLEINGWRSYENHWSGSKAYRDRSQEISDWEALVEEDRQATAGARARAELAERAVKPRPDIPTVTRYERKDR